MAQITPQMVKELRDKTGAGMGDCKKSLMESDGDMEAAIELLRKKGAASAAKRADRAANEGIIVAKTNDDGKLGIIVEVNCETDFVAKNEAFMEYAEVVGNALMNNTPANVDELMKTKVGGETIEDLHNGILAKFSEKIEIRRFKRVETSGFIADYVHAGSKLGVLVEINASNMTDEAKKLLRDIAMQIAAMSPQFIDRDNVDKDIIEKELEIYKQQAIDSGKKPDIAEKIATGKLNKFYQEQCLVEQVFVKDSKKTVTDVIKEISEETGEDVKIVNFLRYNLGDSE